MLNKQLPSPLKVRKAIDIWSEKLHLKKAPKDLQASFRLGRYESPCGSEAFRQTKHTRLRDQVQMLAWPRASCVTLGKSPPFLNLCICEVGKQLTGY